MNQSRKRQIDLIIELSKRMLHNARCGDWDSVAEVDEERRHLVMQCFRQAAAESDAAATASAIRQILSLNDELVELGKQRRGALGGDIQVAKVGRTAKSAYLGCAR